MIHNYLCADIGATHARFGDVRFINNQPVVENKITLDSSAYGQLHELLSEALATLDQSFSAMALALPGPVVNGCCTVTNLPWEVCSKQIETEFSIPTFLLNDLEAQGWGLSSIEQNHIKTFQTGQERKGNACIIAPGSDLGEAILYWDGRQHICFATEGGHCDFSASNDFEMKLTSMLTEQYGQARWGQVLSGPGIATIYRVLSKQIDSCISGIEVSRLSHKGDSDAAKAIMIFLELLGREASNLALKGMAVNGVYIAGGIVPGLNLTESIQVVLKGFNSKPTMSHLLENIPVHLVLDPDLGLLGAANYILHKR